MKQELTNYFFEQGSQLFEFLTIEYLFAQPSLEVNEKIDFVIVTFMGKNLAIELLLDQRAEDITCKIARVFNGQKTPCYAVDENRIRVRESLYSYVRRHGIRNTLVTKVTNLDLQQRIQVTLSDLANTLKKYGKNILSDSTTALTDSAPS
jgi:hypothetical protein